MAAAGLVCPSSSLRQAEVDAFDVIEGLGHRGALRDRSVDRQGPCGAPAAVAWPMSRGVTGHIVLEHVWPYWRRHGLPYFAQFDNDTRFQGGHNHHDVLAASCACV
jgi:hypothetical protein